MRKIHIKRLVTATSPRKSPLELVSSEPMAILVGFIEDMVLNKPN